MTGLSNADRITLLAATDCPFSPDSLHDWRLWKEGPLLREPTEEERAANEAEHQVALEAWPGRAVIVAPLTKVSIGIERRWYCTRCRAFETTAHEGEVW